MDTKTRAWIDLATGVVALIIVISFGMLWAGHAGDYQLFNRSAIDELLLWYFISLVGGFAGGINITKAYYALTGKRPYKK
jgi:hypothetical protein